jgi:hypothetical protein
LKENTPPDVRVREDEVEVMAENVPSSKSGIDPLVGREIRYARSEMYRNLHPPPQHIITVYKCNEH